MINSFPITLKDTAITQEIFGPDIGFLQGKITKKKSPVTNQVIIAILRQISKCTKLEEKSE